MPIRRLSTEFEHENERPIRAKDCAMYLTDKLKGAMFDPDYNHGDTPTSHYKRQSSIHPLHAPGN